MGKETTLGLADNKDSYCSVLDIARLIGKEERDNFFALKALYE